jgi:hypothetical protein
MTLYLLTTELICDQLLGFSVAMHVFKMEGILIEITSYRVMLVSLQDGGISSSRRQACFIMLIFLSSPLILTILR